MHTTETVISNSCRKESYQQLVIVDQLFGITKRLGHMKTISCREAGFECDYIAKGESEEEVLENGVNHVIKEHGMKPEDITPEFKEIATALIRQR